MHRRLEETSDQAQADPPITSGTQNTLQIQHNLYIWTVTNTDLSDISSENWLIKVKCELK